MPSIAPTDFGPVGVLGGMGPAATADFLAVLTARTPATTDQDHLPLVVYSDPRVPDRSDAIQGEGLDPLPWLLKGVEFLDRAGCSVIAIPCNSAHYWFDELQSAVKIPILHIVDAAVASVGEAEPSVIGVLATAGTLASGIYTRRLAESGNTPIVPEQRVIDDLVMPGIRATKAGELDRARGLLIAAAVELIDHGAQHVVLGCTDISAALRAESETGMLPLIDASQALADELVSRFRPHYQLPPSRL